MADIDAALSEITTDIRTIVQGEIELAKAEVIPGAKKAGLGVGLLAGAGVVALLAVNVLFLSLGLAFSALFWGHVGPVASFALGFLCAAGVYLIVAGILAGLGFVQVKKLQSPSSAVKQLDKTVTAVTDAAGRAFASVQALSSFGRKKLATDETGKFVTVVASPPPLASATDPSRPQA